MADIKQKFATSAAITITLNSLASSATGARESTAIDNGTNLYLDALVSVIVDVPSGTIANERCVYVYAFGSEDGTNFNDNVAGTGDAAVTLRDPSNLPQIGVIAIPTQSLTYKKIFSVAQAFGGILPRKWGIVVRNFCGITLNSSGCSASFSGVTAEAV